MTCVPAAGVQQNNPELAGEEAIFEPCRILRPLSGGGGGATASRRSMADWAANACGPLTWLAGTRLSCGQPAGSVRDIGCGAGISGDAACGPELIRLAMAPLAAAAVV